jgi:hypothetical protein
MISLAGTDTLTEAVQVESGYGRGWQEVAPERRRGPRVGDWGVRISQCAVMGGEDLVGRRKKAQEVEGEGEK